MLVEPARVTKVFERRHRLYHVIPASITVVALVALSMLHADFEPAWAKMVRAMSFSGLSVAWVYIVGTQKMHGPHQESSSHFIARFAPVSQVVLVRQTPPLMPESRCSSAPAGSRRCSGSARWGACATSTTSSSC